MMNYQSIVELMYMHSIVLISDCTQHPDTLINKLYTIIITTQRTPSRKRQKVSTHIEYTRDDIQKVYAEYASQYGLN